MTSIACTFAHLTLYCSHFTLGNPKKVYRYTASVSAIDVKFSHNFTYQKSLKSVNFFPRVIRKVKRWTFWDIVYVYLSQVITIVLPSVIGDEPFLSSKAKFKIASYPFASLTVP